MAERDRATTIRMSDEEVTMLQALSEHDGVTVSDYVRLFVRRQYSDRFGSKPPKKPKREKKWLGGA